MGQGQNQDQPTPTQMIFYVHKAIGGAVHSPARQQVHYMMAQLTISPWFAHAQCSTLEVNRPLPHSLL